MKIDVQVDVYSHSLLDYELEEKLDSILDVLKAIQRKEVIMMASLDDLVGKVAEQTTVEQGLIVLTRDIKKALDEALSGVLTPAQQAKVDAVFNKVQSNMDAVSKAVLDNTPQASPV